MVGAIHCSSILTSPSEDLYISDGVQAIDSNVVSSPRAV